MAVTLAQAAVICQDKMKRGIIEELVLAVPLFKTLPFIQVVGNSYAYNRENVAAMGSVHFRQPGGLWTESTATFTPVTAALKVLGEDADVDNFIRATRSTLNDQMAVQVAIKTKLMGHQWEHQAIYGVAATSDGFDGLHTLIGHSATMTFHMDTDATGIALSMKVLDKAINAASKKGKPDVLLVSPNLLVNITAYLRTVGSYQTTRDQYGNEWESWRGIPFVPCDQISDVELCGAAGEFSTETGGLTTSLFVAKFGEDEGLCGLENDGIDASDTWDKLELKDASRTRLKWYTGLALLSTLALAEVVNITDATATA